MSVDQQGYFDELAGWMTEQLEGDELLLSTITGERSDFIRFNNGDVRQAGSVVQSCLGVDLVEGMRHTQGSVQLARDIDMDRARVRSLLEQLRDQRRLVSDDPFLLFNTEPVSTESTSTNTLPTPEAALAHIRAGAGSNDLVGIYAAGDTFTGFANSLGQRNWHQTATFSLDWSFYLRADKAAKNLYAGFEWDDAAFGRKIDWSRQQLAVLEREPISLAPGRYRTYLAPAAMQELVELWSYDAFSEKSHRTRQTPLLRMITEGATFAPAVRISEDTAGGVAPNFQGAGFLRPDEVVFIDGGNYRDTLVSPRSAQEYGVATNGASSGESPESVAVAPGSLPAGDTAGVLDSGLYVGNLWYANFSDQAACRTTGMTRFATFWVEGGEIVAPVNVMRFDDTSYNLFGDNLVGLTDEADVILDSSTYSQRSTASYRLPGMLVEEMSFTL
ncbi:MAG: metallopeptidase TldD-related protein [Acidimicrobiales bacterium]